MLPINKYYSAPTYISKSSGLFSSGIIGVIAYLHALLAGEANADECAYRDQIVPETGPIVDVKRGNERANQH